VLSDTHGFLHPAVAELFAGVAHIIHAGDIMDPAILEALGEIAPLTAVAGNLDGGVLAATLPREVLGEAAGISFAVGHKHKRLLRRLSSGKLLSDAKQQPPRLVVYGHEHVPSASWVEGVLYLNPGTASAPDEEDDAATVAFVSVAPAGLSVTFVPLPRAPRPPDGE
jgi:putative phosphoesterase